MDEKLLKKCLDEIVIEIKEFLKNEGAENTYKTYVKGIVYKDKEDSLLWGTPISQEELTEIGHKNRSIKLYRKLQNILIKYNIDKIIITSNDLQFGNMDIEVKYVIEIKGKITL